MPTRRGTSIERDNPFRPGGDIDKETAELLRSSTISADTVTIVDPSSPQYKKTNGSFPVSPSSETAPAEANEQVVICLNTDNNNTEIKQTSKDSNGGPSDQVDASPAGKKKQKKKKGCQIL